MFNSKKAMRPALHLRLVTFDIHNLRWGMNKVQTHAFKCMWANK